MDGGDEAYYVIESMLPLNRDEIDSDDKSDVSDWLGLVTKKSFNVGEKRFSHTITDNSSSFQAQGTSLKEDEG